MFSFTNRVPKVISVYIQRAEGLRVQPKPDGKQRKVSLKWKVHILGGKKKTSTESSLAPDGNPTWNAEVTFKVPKDGDAVSLLVTDSVDHHVGQVVIPLNLISPRPSDIQQRPTDQSRLQIKELDVTKKVNNPSGVLYYWIWVEEYRSEEQEHKRSKGSVLSLSVGKVKRSHSSMADSLNYNGSVLSVNSTRSDLKDGHKRHGLFNRKSKKDLLRSAADLTQLSTLGRKSVNEIQSTRPLHSVFDPTPRASWSPSVASVDHDGNALGASTDTSHAGSGQLSTVSLKSVSSRPPVISRHIPIVREGVNDESGSPARLSGKVDVIKPELLRVEPSSCSTAGGTEVTVFCVGLSPEVMQYATVLVDGYTLPRQDWFLDESNSDHSELRIHMPERPTGRCWIELETMNHGRLRCLQEFVYVQEPIGRNRTEIVEDKKTPPTGIPVSTTASHFVRSGSQRSSLMVKDRRSFRRDRGSSRINSINPVVPDVPKSKDDLLQVELTHSVPADLNDPPTTRCSRQIDEIEKFPSVWSSFDLRSPNDHTEGEIPIVDSFFFNDFPNSDSPISTQCDVPVDENTNSFDLEASAGPVERPVNVTESSYVDERQPPSSNNEILVNPGNSQSDIKLATFDTRSPSTKYVPDAHRLPRTEEHTSPKSLFDTVSCDFNRAIITNENLTEYQLSRDINQAASDNQMDTPTTSLPNVSGTAVCSTDTDEIPLPPFPLLLPTTDRGPSLELDSFDHKAAEPLPEVQDLFSKYDVSSQVHMSTPTKDMDVSKQSLSESNKSCAMSTPDSDSSTERSPSTLSFQSQPLVTEPPVSKEEDHGESEHRVSHTDSGIGSSGIGIPPTQPKLSPVPLPSEAMQKNGQFTDPHDVDSDDFSDGTSDTDGFDELASRLRSSRRSAASGQSRASSAEMDPAVDYNLTAAQKASFESTYEYNDRLAESPTVEDRYDKIKSMAHWAKPIEEGRSSAVNSMRLGAKHLSSKPDSLQLHGTQNQMDTSVGNLNVETDSLRMMLTEANQQIDSMRKKNVDLEQQLLSKTGDVERLSAELCHLRNQLLKDGATKYLEKPRQWSHY